MRKRRLTKDAQIYIVQQLAMYEKPSKVREAINQLFDADISLQAVMKYQITNPFFPEKWRYLFESTRKAFLDNVSDIPIANKAVRLRELNYLYDRQRNQKDALQNPIEMRSTLEQAAKESGDAFTNKHKFDLSNQDGSLTQPIADAINAFEKSLLKIYDEPDASE